MPALNNLQLIFLGAQANYTQNIFIGGIMTNNFLYFYRLGKAMFNVEKRTIGPGQIYVSLEVINPDFVVAEYLERRNLGMWIDIDPEAPKQGLIRGGPAGFRLFDSIASTPEFLAMVHASNGSLRWMDLKPCGWDQDTKVRLLAASAMVGCHELLRMSCLYNDLKNTCPKGSNSYFQPFLERSFELEVMAEERKRQAEALLAGRPMLTMEEGVKLLRALSDQEIARVKSH